MFYDLIITSINSCRYTNVQGTRPSQPLAIDSESNKVPAAISLVNISKEIVNIMKLMI